MRNYAHENGKFINKNNEEIPLELIKKNDKEINLSIDRYEQNNKDLIVLPIVDNINLFTQEKEFESGRLMSSKETMAKYSGDYCIYMRNRFGMSPVNIQQQAAVNESIDGAKMDMKEPSSANLAEHKGTTRDVDVFITLHSPFRAKQPIYAGYDIKILQDHFRNFRIDLDRNGPSCETNLFFDGATNTFKELPYPNSPEMTSVYKQIEKFK